MFTVPDIPPWTPVVFSKERTTPAWARPVWVVSAVVFAAAAGVAVWWYLGAAEPHGFRDVRWGASGAELRTRVAIAECSAAEPARGDHGTLRCIAEPNVSIGDVTLDDLWFYLRDDHLVAWRARYGHEDHAVMIAALGKRYGRPSIVTDTNIIWRLRGGGVLLTREKFQDVVTVVARSEMALVADPDSGRVIKAAEAL